MEVEFLFSLDMKDYLRVSIDGLDLNYNKYLYEGDKNIVEIEDYNSENTTRMTLDEIERMLLAQPEVISQLEN